MQFELGELKYVYTPRGWCIISTCCIKFQSMVMYISLPVDYFRSMCKSNNSLCIVIYIPHKQLDYYIPKDSCVYQEKCVAFQKCSWHQPSSLSLCYRVFLVNLVTWLFKDETSSGSLSPIQLISLQMKIHLYTELESKEMVI